jgi:hypothetical protein
VKPFIRVILPLALASLSLPAAAAVRCVDKAGKTIYMERPCETYGYKTDRQIKDPPKGDGTGAPLRSGQALVGSPSQQGGGGARQPVQMFCDGRQILCTPGDTVVCGSQRQVCDRD